VLRALFCLFCLALATLLPGLALAGRAYVSNEDDGTVAVVSLEDLKVLAAVPVGKRPRGLVLSRDGTRLYVAVSGMPKCPPPMSDAQCAQLPRDDAADAIAVVDTARLAPLAHFAGVSDPERVELSRDGRTLYVTEEDAAQVAVLDSHTGAVLAHIPVGHEPEGVRISPDGRSLLVTSEADNTVSVIDVRRNEVRRTVSVGKRPRDAAFSADGHVAFVPGEADGSLYRVSVATDAPATRLLEFPAPARPMGIALDAQRHRLYVSTGRGGSIALISGAGDNLLGQMTVGGRPWGIALSADGQRLVSADGPAGELAVLDAPSLTVRGKVAVGHGPWGVVLGP
jgi:YVTN family beta-propeller protein